MRPNYTLWYGVTLRYVFEVLGDDYVVNGSIYKFSSFTSIITSYLQSKLIFPQFIFFLLGAQWNCHNLFPVASLFSEEMTEWKSRQEMGKMGKIIFWLWYVVVYMCIYNLYKAFFMNLILHQFMNVLVLLIQKYKIYIVRKVVMPQFWRVARTASYVGVQTATSHKTPKGNNCCVV